MAAKKKRKQEDDLWDFNEGEFTVTENDGVCALHIGGRIVKKKKKKAGAYDAILAFARKQLG